MRAREHFIRVNAICPTAVDTPMIQNEHLHRAFRPDLDAPGREDVKAEFAEMNLLPIPWVDPVDMSNAIVWLASDAARYVTGVTLPVDAGTTSSAKRQLLLRPGQGKLRMRTQAAVLYEAGTDWKVEDIELDPPRAGEVLVRVAAAGLCHSEEHHRAGDVPFAGPMIGGHEGAGYVEAVGPGVSRWPSRATTSCSPRSRTAGGAPRARAAGRTCATSRPGS